MGCGYNWRVLGPYRSTAAGRRLHCLPPQIGKEDPAEVSARLNRIIKTVEEWADA